MADKAGGYSLGRAIRSAVNNGGTPDGLEREISEELKGRNSVDGFRVPPFAFGSRDLLADTATDGAELVGEDAQRTLPLLRPNNLVTALGVTVVTGLKGDAKFPKISTGSGAAWASTETGTTSESDPQFGEVSLVPKHIAGGTTYSRQLLAQSPESIEKIVRDDVTRAISTEIDVAVVQGDGASGRPTGVVSTTSVTESTVATPGQPTKAELFEYLSDLEAGNALSGSLGWVCTPAVAAHLKSTLIDSNVAGAMWNLESNTVLGYKAVTHSGVSSNTLIFGNWADVLVGVFGDGSVDVIVDPYSQAKSRKVVLTASLMVDIGVRRAESFCKNV